MFIPKLILDNGYNLIIIAAINRKDNVNELHHKGQNYLEIRTQSYSIEYTHLVAAYFK